jgi:hypothetical protein
MHGARLTMTDHPCVVVPVRRVRPRFQVVEHPSCLHFLTERDEIRLLALLQAPLFVRPKGTRCTDARLDLVDDEECSMLLGDQTEGTEKGRRGVFVASFGEDGFYDDCGDWLVGFAAERTWNRQRSSGVTL